MDAHRTAAATAEAQDERLHLPEYEFVYSYLARTGVISPERLARESPDFVRRYRTATGVEPT